MYSKKEASELRQQFWTAFGQYMLPIAGAEGEKINWINYKTGEKEVYFKMAADSKSASISIEMAHKDLGLQQIYFDQFQQLRNLLQSVLTEEWDWEPQVADEHNRTISRIITRVDGVNIFDRNDWPKLISFFKPRLIALDAFWSSAKYAFEALR
ncbi:MAG: hypothetical protein JWP69_786 [Flaviaesturariibacter sp.]|nr:hypothetical protein [Flaviaesturariibacter sp.]